MNIQITTRHESHISDDTKTFIEDEVRGLTKFYDKITSAHVVCDRETHKNGQEDTIELDLSVDGTTLSAKATEENLGKALDAVVEKMTRQLKKKNEKVKEHK